MSEANDNQRTRRVRDGFLAQWAGANFAEIASDDALLRLSEARNTSSNSANKFMLAGAVTALLYLLRLEGVAKDLAIAQYSLKDIPFGLFVLAATAVSLSTISLVRTGDSRAYDRQLRLACEKRYGSDCHLRYIVFPNEKAWGEPFSTMSSVIQAGWLMSIVRTLALTSISIFLLALVAGPIVVSLDFLVEKRYLVDTAFRGFQFWAICFLTAANGLTLILTFWARLSDRG